MTAFLLSAVGLAGVTYQLVQNGDRLKKLLGNLPLYSSIMVWAVLLALIYYARQRARNRVLR